MIALTKRKARALSLVPCLTTGCAHHAVGLPADLAGTIWSDSNTVTRAATRVKKKSKSLFATVDLTHFLYGLKKPHPLLKFKSFLHDSGDLTPSLLCYYRNSTVTWC